MNNKIKIISKIAVSCALVCAISPLSITIGIIPFSLSIFIIFLASALNKPYQSLLVVILYILIGVIGVPVFSNFSSGFGVILGPTGGYIIGYIPAAFIISFLIERHKDNIVYYFISMILALIVCYLIGTIWYSILVKISFFKAFKVCVLPFILIDMAKIIIASISANRINKINFLNN